MSEKGCIYHGIPSITCQQKGYQGIPEVISCRILATTLSLIDPPLSFESLAKSSGVSSSTIVLRGNLSLQCADRCLPAMALNGNVLLMREPMLHIPKGSGPSPMIYPFWSSLLWKIVWDIFKQCHANSKLVHNKLSILYMYTYEANRWVNKWAGYVKCMQVILRDWFHGHRKVALLINGYQFCKHLCYHFQLTRLKLLLLCVFTEGVSWTESLLGLLEAIQIKI